MARLFVPAERLAGERLTVDGDGFRHLTKVLRLGAGDTLCVFDGRGTEIEARIVAVGARAAELALGARRALAPPACAITLLQAVPRGDRMDLVVQKTTELGVARVVPVVAARSVAHPPADRRRRWQTIAQEAARQCGRADVPEIAEPVALAAAIAALPAGPARLVLWEEERARPLRAALGAPAVALLVGPEGGFAASEVEAVRAAGFTSAGLGPRILRAETAAIVAVALAQAAAGGLD